MTAAAPTSGPLAAIGEYFSFRQTLALHERLSAAARRSIADSLSLGRQRADAADSLWANGHTAEALPLAIEALEATTDVAPQYALGVGVPALRGTRAESAESQVEEVAAGSTDGPERFADIDAPAVSAFVAPDAATTRATALRARGMTDARIETVEAALSAARAAKPPLLDSEVSAADAELFRQLMDARRLVDGAFSAAALERREIVFTRAARIGTTAILALAATLGVYFGTRTPEGVFVETSAVWANAPAFVGETVIDGRRDTFWLLPDGATGWVEVQQSPSRRVEHVTVLNSNNAPHGDRATRDYRIEIYAGGRVARSIDGSFEYSTAPEPVTHEVGIDDVERIRFVVRSHHQTGAGLAELTWD